MTFIVHNEIVVTSSFKCSSN